MRGVGALPTARAQQPELGAPGQDQVQGLLLQPVPDQPGAEVAEHGEVEPWVVQFQAEEELPVHTGPHLVSGLPVGESLGVLQHRGQRQHSR